MHIILTGATGTVGSACLRTCLAAPQITRLSILSRRQFALPVGDGLDHQKAQIIVHEDYTSYPASVLDLLKGAEGCIWAQGISQTQVSKEEYIRITYDFPMASAKAFSTLSESNKFNFVYVSGEGADPKERSYSLFGKIKGRAEASLRALPSTPSYSALRVFNVRPGFVDSSPNPKENRPALSPLIVSHHLLIGLARVLFLHRYISPTDILAKVLIDLATGDGSPIPPGTGIEDDGYLVTSPGIRKLGGL